MRILIFDCETAPKLAYVWGIWQQNIGLPMLEADGYMLSWSAKWLGQDDVMSDSLYNHGNSLENEGALVEGLWQLMNEADILVTYNGNKFDIPVVNTAMIRAGMTPPTASKSIDLYRIVSRVFSFTSKKLDYVCKQLGLETKVQHSGFELWRKCMLGDKDAWAEMIEYNEQDVVITEQLYLRLRPWIKNHPNVNIVDEDDETVRCAACGSDHLKKNGWEYLTAGAYQRYVCNDCGANNRGRTIANSVAKRKSLTTTM